MKHSEEHSGCDDPSPPLKEYEQFSGRRPGFGMAKTFASSVPGHNLPVGKEGGKDSAGNLKFIGTYRGFFEVSTVMHFEECKRFPKELFLPGFPTRD